MLKKSKILSIKLCYGVENKFNEKMKNLIIKNLNNKIECYKQKDDIYLDYDKNLDNLYICTTKFFDLIPYIFLNFEQFVYLNKILFKKYFNIP